MPSASNASTFSVSVGSQPADAHEATDDPDGLDGVVDGGSPRPEGGSFGRQAASRGGSPAPRLQDLRPPACACDMQGSIHTSGFRGFTRSPTGIRRPRNVLRSSRKPGVVGRATLAVVGATRQSEGLLRVHRADPGSQMMLPTSSSG